MLGRAFLRRAPGAPRRLACLGSGKRLRASAAGASPDPAVGSARFAVGAAAAAAAAAAFLLAPDRRLAFFARCEEPAAGGKTNEVKLTTYNLLSPPLCTESHFPKCAPEAVAHQNRLPKILQRLKEETAAGAVVGLQEVDLTWAGKLHTFFAENGYTCVFAQYGKPFNGYMGVMLAWPTDRYEVLDVEIARISDTAPKGVWPKVEKGAPALLSPFGFLTYNGLKEVLGCRPPELRQENKENLPPGEFEWKVAKDRYNEAIFAKLRPRGKGGRAFAVATYHMPCLFGPPEKVRVVNIHTYLLMAELKKFAAGAPAVLMGDFNFKPGTSPYLLAASGGSFEAAAAAQGGAAELEGLKQRLPAGPLFPSGLESAYHAIHKKEPLFTNFAQTAGMDEPFVETLDFIWYTPGSLKVVDCPKLFETREEAKGPFPNAQEPSDHIPLRATVRIVGN